MRLYDKLSHKLAVRALFRSLLRRVKGANITISATNPDHAKYSLDPQLYISYLKSEWKYNLRMEFSSMHKTEKSFAKSFLRGVEIDQRIATSESRGDALVEVMLEYRKTKFQEQKWRANYLERKQDIQKQDDKAAKELQLRKQESKLKKPIDPKQIFHRLEAPQKHRVVLSELKASKEFSEHLLRRYLKLKQQSLQLPNPAMLPNTPDIKEIPEYKSKYALPGSTRHDLIKAGYDTEYIDAIVKPSLEYDINKYHYLNNLQHIVNNKGPYPVKIATTSAGPIPMPYIKVPFARPQQMKQIALDTKKLWTVIRIRNVWVSEPGTIKDEKMFSDGRYSIPGSRGFGPEQFMYPRSYYQKLAESEALWEYVLDRETGGSRSFSSYVSDWTEHLDINTKVLEAKVDAYFSKYSQLRTRNSSLQKERDALQLQMNEHYDQLVATYDSLINELNTQGIFKHSEIVNPAKVTQTYPQILDTTPHARVSEGIPELERIGMGKKLGDYLREAGVKSFSWGEKFYKRFKFDIKKT
ncbi:uncharacterized protein CANTADRAFT_43554 [Suhomyces tanzawaensis NRRL Y-17324]|uniref:Uncharacterized protein n=1 Tax=Suhomyces tanzawaensis NRRL Y-17324 TaxID=984487 RepID=A0A1E4SQN1_9ASCO|nr:uncharacterized protein CANTADRAFT_43554 [Suhomyces tanzawaensis NRRL Y-17324]ODV81820.1 hypothetical protein CANTADRAFT_43554 [Suhomyces tanzawaensis NRRL Y-17324]